MTDFLSRNMSHVPGKYIDTSGSLVMPVCTSAVERATSESVSITLHDKTSLEEGFLSSSFSKDHENEDEIVSPRCQPIRRATKINGAIMLSGYFLLSNSVYRQCDSFHHSSRISDISISGC